MQRRLVLGCGSPIRGTIERLAEWPGELTVIADCDPDTLKTRGGSISFQRGDPADTSIYPSHADLVFVASDDAETNAVVASKAGETYPRAQVIAYVDIDAGTEARARIESVADRVVDAQTALHDRLRDVTIGLEADRLHRLFSALRRIDGRLAVVMHDNPDPDAIASALALSRIASAIGVDADPCYFGEISHQENRALVNLLGLDLIELNGSEGVEEYGGVALVDHSRPGVNDGLPEATEIDIVVDHHPPRAPVEAHFVDLRHEVGSTSTLLAEYLRRAGIDPEESLATALLYGIRVDTNDFAREVSPADFESAAWLLEHADLSLLDRVESPSMTPAVVKTLARAIRNRDVRGDALASNVGAITDRDALAQAADRLLNMDGIRIAVVYGFKDGTVYVSGRARGTDVDLGETLRDALDAIGSAGGHADMAGAQIPLGILGESDKESSAELTSIVTDVIAGRLFETLEDATTLLDLDSDSAEWAYTSPFDSLEE